MNTPILKRVIEDFDDRMNNIEGKSRKWTFLSAHDTHIFNLIGDLNISSANCIEELYRKGTTDSLNCYQGPEYTASLII